jgi:hypothetical protein
VYRRVFIDLLVRYRRACGLPALDRVRLAQMSDDELFRAVRKAREACDAKTRRGSENETSANAARAQRKGGRGTCP